MTNSSPNPVSFDFKKTLKKHDSALMQKINLVDNYLNRPVAALIVRLVFPTRITPNHLTYFSTLLGLTAAVLFSRGSHFFFILAGIFAQFSSITDGADGMLARFRKTGNRYGAYLDLIFDRLVDFFLFLGISWGSSLAYQNHRLLLLGLLASGLYLLEINIFYMTKSFLEQKQTGETGGIRAILYWAILILSILNRLDIFIYSGLAIVMVDNLVRLIVFLRLGEK